MLFQNVYQGFDVDAELIYNNNIIIQINVNLIDNKQKRNYFYKLIQQTPKKIIMLDSFDNILSELELSL